VSAGFRDEWIWPQGTTGRILVIGGIFPLSPNAVKRERRGE